jgi:hypothetical protein
VLYAAGRGDVTDVWSAGRRVVADGVPTAPEAATVTDDLRDLQRVVAALRDDGGRVS